MGRPDILRPMPAKSPAIEDYLKTVYGHTEWQPDPITPKALADRLGIAPSSVTEMVKKMAAGGLVSHVPYGAVRLTSAGHGTGARRRAPAPAHRDLAGSRDGLRLGRGARRGRDPRARDLRPTPRSDRRTPRPAGPRSARRSHPVGRRHAAASADRAARRGPGGARGRRGADQRSATLPCSVHSTRPASVSTPCSR